MLFSNWYFSMIFIIIATTIYQTVWLKNNGYRNTVKPSLLQRLGAWVLVLTPIVNTLIGICAMFVLVLYVTREEAMIEVIDNMDRFEKVK